MLSPSRLVLRSLIYHWRIHASVAMAAAAATAVLTGALIVGDSMRGSLRDLVIGQLGNIDHVVVADHFFREDLAIELSCESKFQRQFQSAHSAFFLQVAVERQASTGKTQNLPGRASGVMLWGLDEGYAGIGTGGPGALPGRNEIVLNEALAEELNANVGDRIIVRLPRMNQIPSESPFGRKADNVRNLAGLKVIAVIPTQGLARFSLRPSQHLPLTAFVRLATIQRALRRPGVVNTILVTVDSESQLTGKNRTEALRKMLPATLVDYGFHLERIRTTYRASVDEPEETVLDYFNLTSDRMMFPTEVDVAVDNSLAADHVQPVLTYLANSIRLETSGVGGREIPYSTVTAVDSVVGIGPMVSTDGELLDSLMDDEIVLTSWAAERLNLQLGDTVHLTYFEPESTHGKATESSATFQVCAVVPLTEPIRGYQKEQPAVFDVRPTAANDPHLTPTVEGLTDRDSLANWDPPFPFDQRRILPPDEEYWDNHRTTPKAYISLDTGRRMWGTDRFGKTTSYRIPVRDGLTVERLENKLVGQLTRDGLQPGFQFLPVRDRALQAAQGTTSFSGLFLGFSLFIIAAALMLVVLLFRLGVQLRVGEIGTFAALGYSQRMISAIFISEGAMVAGVGGLLGIGWGIAFAWLMLVGLRTWWLAAIVTPFLQLHVSDGTLIVGWLAGVLMTGLCIGMTMRRMRRISVRRLLSRKVDEEVLLRGTSRRSQYIIGSLLGVAIGLVAIGNELSGEAQAGAFFGCGAAVLGAGLCWLNLILRRQNSVRSSTSRALSLSRFAFRNVARNHGRSVLTVGLMATAVFLIAAISCFRLEPSLAGSGGFDLVATSDHPIFDDLNTVEGRDAVGILDDDARKVEQSKLLAYRVNAGDDASCLNLYRPSQPQIIGVPLEVTGSESTIAQPPFQWSETTAATDMDRSNPWRLLEQQFDDGAVPVILDKNTAMYSMHLFMMRGAGVTFEIEQEDGTFVQFRIVGLLSNSVFQGKLLISETQFKRLFPTMNGYRFFLIRTPGMGTDVTDILEERLGDQGLDVRRSSEVLTSLLAVQNTYLSTFQSLGALGLLLGTFGMATVQLRNVVQRRSELAVMRAMGLRRSQLVITVIWEHTLLLSAGLVIGIVAAALAVFPHWWNGGATVPVLSLMSLFGIVTIVGIISGLAGVIAILRARLVPALRGD